MFTVCHSVLVLNEVSANGYTGFDTIQVGLRTLPIGFGIIGGSFIALLLISWTKGRVKAIMIIFTVVMTAFTAACSVATPDNIAMMYVIVSFASLGVGGVIIPSSIVSLPTLRARLLSMQSEFSSMPTLSAERNKVADVSPK